MTTRLELSKHFKHVFKSKDLGRVFVECFRFLMKRREYFDLHDHDSLAAKDSEVYKAVHHVCRDLLLAAAPNMRAVPNSSHRRTLPPLTAAAVEQELSRVTSGAVATRAVFPIVLGLMTAIDTYMGSLLLESYRPTSSDQFPHVTPLSPLQPFAKFRGAGSPPDPPPEVGIPLQHLQLEAYFSNLCVTPQVAEFAEPIPSIYRPPRQHSEIPTRIRIGIASILTEVDNIEWAYDDTRFWGVALAPGSRDEIARRLQWIFTKSVELGVNVLVLPELNVDAALESLMVQLWAESRQSRLMLAVTGLTHRREPDADAYKNGPLVFVGEGVVPWPYWKSEPVRFNFAGLGLRTEALGEKPRYLAAIDTPAGRVCILICKDALMNECQRAAFALRSTLVIIPSMTSKGSIPQFLNFAKLVASANRGTTVFCNSSIHVRSASQDASLGFVHPGVKFSNKHLPQHTVPSKEAGAVLAVYELSSDSSNPSTRTPQIIWTPDSDTLRSTV